MSEQIRVVVAEVGEPAEVKEIGSGLEPMQQVVGGLIEPIRIRGAVFLVANEEGRMRGMAPNRTFTITDEGFQPGFIPGNHWSHLTVVGPVFITKTKGSTFTALTEEEAEEFRQMLDEARVEVPDA
jgi:hypothetical protein